MVNVELEKLKPTWVNNEFGDAWTTKRLDRIFVHHTLLDGMIKFWSWVEDIRFLDQFPIILELSWKQIKSKVPYKYNPTWGQIDEYKQLIHEHWRNYDHPELPVIVQFCN